jgi:hypothetical protein
MLDRGAKAEVLGEHDELQDIPAQAASEAKPTLGGNENIHVRTTAVGMEWTSPD